MRESERIEGEIQLGGKATLVLLWKRLLERYDDVEVHDEFVLGCWREQCLTFASRKYAQILQVNPQEPMARRMRKKIIALASARFEVGVRPRLGFRVPSLNSLAMLLSTVLLISGFFIPGLRNLVGLGAAILALTLGIRVLFIRPE